jgi:hypothetical protein
MSKEPLYRIGDYISKIQLELERIIGNSKTQQHYMLSASGGGGGDPGGDDPYDDNSSDDEADESSDNSDSDERDAHSRGKNKRVSDESNHEDRTHDNSKNDVQNYRQNESTYDDSTVILAGCGIAIAVACYCYNANTVVENNREELDKVKVLGIIGSQSPGIFSSDWNTSEVS